MVSLTVSVSQEIRELMDMFPEINWSGFVKKSITDKVQELFWREEMLKKLKEEESVMQWAVQLQRSSRRGRLGELKKKGMVK